MTTLQEITSKYLDYRLFGGVVLLPGSPGAPDAPPSPPCDRIVGPVSTQGPWRSIDPVEVDRRSITRMYGQGTGEERTMGAQQYVRYAMFRGQINFYPIHARKTGVTAADVGLLIEALLRCWTTTDPTQARQFHLRQLDVVVACRSVDAGGIGWRLIDRVAAVKPLGRCVDDPDDYVVENQMTDEDRGICEVFTFDETSPQQSVGDFVAYIGGAAQPGRKSPAFDRISKMPSMSFVVHVEIVNGNPNGDPDNGNAPRTVELAGGTYAEITNVCVNRKLKTYLVSERGCVIAGMPGVSLDDVLSSAGPSAKAASVAKAAKKTAKAAKKGRRSVVDGGETEGEE